ADNRRITGIVGMYGDGTVTEHGFRTRGGDGDVVAGFPQRDIAVGVGFDVFVGFAVGQRVLEVPHVAVAFTVFDFQIGDGGFQHRVPVHQPCAAIDQVLVV